MNNQKMISYIQKGEEKLKNVNFFNKKEITKDIFKTTYQEENNYEFYHIKNEIEYLHLKNIIFNKNSNFVVPDNTILILDNCLFKSEKMDFTGGNIEIIHPKLMSYQYTNYIYFKDVDNINIIIGKDNRSFPTIKGIAKRFSLNTLSNIDILNSLSITADKIILTKTNHYKAIKLIGNHIILNKSNIYINDKNDITANTLELQQSSMDNQKNSLNVENLYLNKSNIYFNTCYNNEGIHCKNMILKESNITTEDNLSIDCDNIKIDNQSKFIVGNSINFQNITYTAKEENLYLELDEKTLKQRYLVSILKEIKNRLQEKDKIKKRIKDIK